MRIRHAFAVVWMTSVVALAACDDEPLRATPSNPVLACQPGETRACYEGPLATENVGVCDSGVQACAQHGRGWGPCVGQRLPAQEDCDTPEDENCDGLTSCGQTLWARRIGLDNDEVVYASAADELGATYVTGFYRDPIDLGGGVLPASNGTRNVFVAKFDDAGEHRWSLGMVGDAHLAPHRVAVSPAGDATVFVAAVSGEITIGGSTLPALGGNDVLIAKLDANGELVWVKRLGDDEGQVPTGVALDDVGHVFVTGYFEGEIDLALGEPLRSAGFESDAFVLELDGDGSALWGRAFNGPLDQIPRDIAVSGDHVFVTGSFGGSVDFGGGSHTARGASDDMFLLALDHAGHYAFSEGWGGDGDDVAFALDTDSAGNAVLTGRFEQSMRVGPAVLDAIGAGAIAVIKVDREGDVSWAARLGGSSDQSSTDLVVDSRDRIVVAGYYIGDVSFGVETLPSSGLTSPNIWVAKLEPSGEPVWARGIAVDGDQNAGGVLRGWRSIAVLPGDFIALGGFAVGALDLGDGPLEPGGGADLLVAKLAP